MGVLYSWYLYPKQIGVIQPPPFENHQRRMDADTFQMVADEEFALQLGFKEFTSV